jgi:hypothetical protein
LAQMSELPTVSERVVALVQSWAALMVEQTADRTADSRVSQSAVQRAEY